MPEQPKRKLSNGRAHGIPMRQTLTRQQTGRRAKRIVPYDVNALRGRVKALSEQMGYSLSRSILIAIPKTEEAEKIPPSLVSGVLSKLEETLRGVQRLRAATAIVGHQRYSQLCRELNFASDALDGIPDWNALRHVIEILEKEAGAISNRHADPHLADTSA